MARKTPKDADLASRIQRILDEEFSGNKSAMARAIGADPSGSTITNWLRRNRGMDPVYAFRLQDKYRWNARWILEGKPPARIEPLTAREEAVLARLRELPEEQRRAIDLILDSL